MSVAVAYAHRYRPVNLSTVLRDPHPAYLRQSLWGLVKMFQHLT